MSTHQIKSAVSGFVHEIVHNREFFDIETLREEVERSCSRWEGERPWEIFLGAVDTERLELELAWALRAEIDQGFSNSPEELKERLEVASIKEALGIDDEPEDTCPMIDAFIKAARSGLDEIQDESEEFSNLEKELEELREEDNPTPEQESEMELMEERLKEMYHWHESEIDELENLINSAEELRSACSQTRENAKKTLKSFYEGIRSFKALDRLFFVDFGVSTFGCEIYRGPTEWAAGGYAFDFSDAEQNLHKLHAWNEKIADIMQEGTHFVLDKINNSSLKLVPLECDAPEESKVIFSSLLKEYASARARVSRTPA